MSEGKFDDIIDKNVRIGAGVIIHSYLGKPDEDGDGNYVRDGIVIIPQNGVVPAGTTTMICDFGFRI